MDPTLAAQIKPYEPWLIIAGVFILFILLRVTRRALRTRVDRIGYRLLGERGLFIWFWLNAPGVILHELSHALVVCLFWPFGFRISSITLFRIKQMQQRGQGRHIMKNGGRLPLQLGEVQYTRIEGRFMNYIGDGFSGIAPLFGGIAMFALLYWVATGYNIWDLHLQLFRPGWPWWTLLFAPYLILTVTTELWPSRQDWRGARWLVVGILLLATLLAGLLWFAKVLVFNGVALQATASIALHINFALGVLLVVDAVFLIVADVLARMVRG
jgi:hypothetical protein